jgi:hypothetical protein
MTDVVDQIGSASGEASYNASSTGVRRAAVHAPSGLGSLAEIKLVEGADVCNVHQAPSEHKKSTFVITGVGCNSTSLMSATPDSSPAPGTARLTSQSVRIITSIL